MFWITQDPGEGVAYVYLAPLDGFTRTVESEIIPGRYATVVIDRDEGGDILGIEFIV